VSRFARTALNQVKRLPDRGRYEQEEVYAILDSGLICHVGFVQGEQPFVIPTLHARDGDSILLHGATTSRMMQHLRAGHPVAITVTIVDGIVLARSIFHHSINYRSAVVFGHGEAVEAPEEKMAALARFSERLLPGRWADAREPNTQELKATAVVRVPITSASAKLRVGPPKDDAEDLELPVWAGVLPLAQVPGELVAAPDLRSGIDVPAYLEAYIAARS
jgi:uncharacterized protein